MGLREKRSKKAVWQPNSMQKPKTADRFLSIFCWIEAFVGAVVNALEEQTDIRPIVN
jgi:hypothetical protein